MNDRNIIADALLEARRLTEELTLSKTPSHEHLALVDAKLKRAIEAIDSPVTNRSAL